MLCLNMLRNEDLLLEQKGQIFDVLVVVGCSYVHLDSLPAFLLLSAFQLKNEGLASTSKARRLSFFLCLFTVDNAASNAELIDNKLLSRLEEVVSA